MGLEPVAGEEEEVIHFKAIYRSHNLLKRSFKPKATVVSSLLLDPQVYFLAYYSLQSVLKPIRKKPMRKHQQHRVYYSISESITKSITSLLRPTLQSTVSVEDDYSCIQTVGAEVNASIYSAYTSLHLIPTDESLR